MGVLQIYNKIDCGFKPLAVKVNQYNLEGNFIRTFECIADAERSLNLIHSHISECCKGKRKTSNGYIWRYERRNDLLAYQY